MSKAFFTHCISFFLTYSPPGPSFINLFVQYLVTERYAAPPTTHGERPRDTNPGRADLVAGTLTTRPPSLSAPCLAKSRLATVLLSESQDL